MGIAASYSRYIFIYFLATALFSSIGGFPLVYVLRQSCDVSEDVCSMHGLGCVSRGGGRPLFLDTLF